MGSENPTGAGNQQETEGTSRLELDPQWIVGFVDGEGCFSVAVHCNPYVRRTRGWQLQAAFQVYQHEDDREVLDALTAFFGCGRVRSKGPNSRVLTFTVSSMQDLVARVIPFFEAHPLVVKAIDFAAFTDIVRSMQRKEHLSREGFERLARLAYSMNKHGKQRARTIEEVLEGSPETARQVPPPRKL